ncbi:LOW QUALITY PROTEIN: NADP-dependent oxidoreductase domain-containing protein [Colletotrichum acutatum]|uniref:NADP-dependent oxidoreductase domain-containing protein n=1 Tax=Glomerella acutata TaxID=27357 RepID=A0AAD8XM59_GLOAC|nr:LOW QUALITY PROTEIN: NADP-dependent oxidoreductase domain-containing protein [Colletotrichum acutatum]KAK1729958.1 LOW QUALITY PROTEIN: NADP-dependent oxidoreductase domain-containing protein [Colletotrichum acutatum]
MALPAPKSLLGCYRLIASTVGILVSPTCLGTMNLGGAMNDSLGECTKQSARSKKWLSEWLTNTVRRHEFVLAPNLHLSIEASLEETQITYVDPLYLHFWDVTADIPECNDYARHRGLRQLSVYQGRRSAADRDFERDIIPTYVMDLAPLGTLGHGLAKEVGRETHSTSNGREVLGSEKLEKIANRNGVAITSVALAYILHKAHHKFPAIGGPRLDYIKGNVETPSLQLREEDLGDIKTAYPFDIGLSHDVLSGNINCGARRPQDIRTANVRRIFDYIKDINPILPRLP